MLIQPKELYICDRCGKELKKKFTYKSYFGLTVSTREFKDFMYETNIDEVDKFLQERAGTIKDEDEIRIEVCVSRSSTKREMHLCKKCAKEFNEFFKPLSLNDISKSLKGSVTLSVE